MSILDDLRTYLLADATVAGLVGTRLYPLILPQNPTMPAISCSEISGQRVHSTDGATGLTGPRVQIDCWGSSYAQAVSVFEAVRKRMDGKTTGDIQGMFVDSQRDFYESEPALYRRSMDAFVWHSEAVT